MKLANRQTLADFAGELATDDKNDLLPSDDISNKPPSGGDIGSKAEHIKRLFQKLSGLSAPEAVIQCAAESNAITRHRARQLRMMCIPGETRFADLVGPEDTLVQNAEEMRKVPPGAFIAFILVTRKVVSQEIIDKRIIKRIKGRRHLTHVMLSLGNGRAVGSQSKTNLGLPVDDKWRIVDLADVLNWASFPFTYDSIALSLGRGPSQHLRIRYRELESFQGPQPTWPEEETEVPANQRVLNTDKYGIISKGEVWYVGQLASCVAVAAITPAGTLDDRKADKEIFVYHSGGGLVDVQGQACAALIQFLNGRRADWVFVHGTENRDKRAFGPFLESTFYEDIVLPQLEFLITAGPMPPVPKIIHYYGDSLQIDSNGEIVNKERLLPLEGKMIK